MNVFYKIPPLRLEFLAKEIIFVFDLQDYSAFYVTAKPIPGTAFRTKPGGALQLAYLKYRDLLRVNRVVKQNSRASSRRDTPDLPGEKIKRPFL